MNIEYEATFFPVEVEAMRARLVAAGAVLLRAEYLQRRAVFHLPEGHAVAGGWVRVRDEGDKITISVKVVDGETITDQKETCVTVDSFLEAQNLLRGLGCVQKAYQETKRELWMLDGVEITIDTWPFLAPFVEVEGKHEVAVRSVSERIGFAWSEARFCAVDALYAEVYNIAPDVINNQTPQIVFGMENPFV